MFEQLLNLRSKLLKTSTLLKLNASATNLVLFYTSFLAQESLRLSNRNLFVWKSANFADSYWFLYNDKNSLNETLTLK